MSATTTRSPDWDRLFELAAAHEDVFTTQQAAEAGYSPQLIAHHLGAGRMRRVRRGAMLAGLTAGHLNPEAWSWSEADE